MGEKFDINTLFRLVIPGYLVIFVYYFLELTIPDKDYIPFLLFIGIPIGFLMHVVYRYFFIFFEKSLIKNDVDSIKSCIKNLNGLTDNQIAELLDYILMTHSGMEHLNSHIRFHFTRMHSYGKAIVAIFSGFVFFLGNPGESLVGIIGRVFILIVFIFFLFVNYNFMRRTRIPEWRRLIINTHRSDIERAIPSYQNT